MGFFGQQHLDLRVEVLDRSALVARMGAEFFARPDRPAFDTLMLVHSGSGTHTIDFERVVLVPGRLVRVRAGQVQRWDPHAAVKATLVVSRTVPSGSLRSAVGRAPTCDLGTDSLATATSLVDALHREQHRFSGEEPSIRLMDHLFGALDALADAASPAPATGPLPAAFLAFTEAVERDLSGSHQVRDVARRLGYSERTLSRACRLVTGRTAKGVITARLVLEAKRLLAHTDRPVSAVATELGYSEPTNFHKFFMRETHQSPTRFRTEHRAGR